MSIIDGKMLLFIGGLHRSGTSILHRLLRSHPAVSGFSGTGAPEDEGQYLQDVFPSAMVYGGPGRFAFDRRAHLTEESALKGAEARNRLLQSWKPYWDMSRRVLVEKSPPNLIRARFLRAVFPESYFIFLVRHPVAVAMATRKWSDQPVEELINHWAVAHEVFLEDFGRLDRCAWVRYEDFVAKPDAMLADICRFAHLSPEPLSEPVEAARNEHYFAEFEQEGGLRHPVDAGAARLIGAFGYDAEAPYYLTAPGESGLVARHLHGMPPALPAGAAKDLAPAGAIPASEPAAVPGAVIEWQEAEWPDDPEVTRNDHKLRLALRRFLGQSALLRNRKLGAGKLALLVGIVLAATALEFLVYRAVSPMIPPVYFVAEDVASAIAGWSVIACCTLRALVLLKPPLAPLRHATATELFNISLTATAGLLLISPGTLTTVAGLLLLLRPVRRLCAHAFTRMAGGIGARTIAH